MQKVTIPGYEKYYITDEGKVFRKGKKEPLKAFTNHNKQKCYRVTLSKRGKVKTFSISRLMQLAFFSEYPDFLLRHKDGDKSNFNLDNLEIMRDKVVKIVGDEVTFYNCIEDCAKENMFSVAAMRDYCNKKRHIKYNDTTYMFEKDYMEMKENGSNESCQKTNETTVRI